MFTGIVQALGKVAATESRGRITRLVIDRGDWQPHPPIQHGDSICISGVCLTVTGLDGRRLSFDAVSETMSRTTLGELGVGDAVNLEPALTPSTPMGGHIVQGHVDGVGRVARVHAGDDWRITIRPPVDLMPCITPKGSIAVSGVSLTIADVRATEFDLALIPTTLELTTLASIMPGQRVNLETDIVAKTIVHWLTRQHSPGGEGSSGSPITLEDLQENGFFDNPLA